jgi:hypothetical protein
MQQPRWLLNASSFRRMHTIACRPAFSMLPPPVPSTQGTAATSSRTTSPSFPFLAEVLSLSRTRTPHAVSFAAFIFIDGAGGPGPVSFEFQNLAPPFSTPAKLFQFSIQTYTSLFYLAGKRNRLAGRELN